MRKNFPIAILFVFICLAILSCKAEPLTEDSTPVTNLTVSKVLSSDLGEIDYDYSVFSLTTVTRSTFFQSSGHIAKNIDKYTFQNVPFGLYEVSVTAYINGDAVPVYSSTEEIEISEKNIGSNGVISHSISVASEDLLDSSTDNSSADASSNEQKFEDVFAVSFYDADGTTPVELGSDGFYTFRMVNGVEGHTINASVKPLNDSISDYTCTWSVGYSKEGYDDPAVVKNIIMTPYSNQGSDEAYFCKLPETGSADKTSAYQFLYFRDEKDRENAKGYLLRLVIKSGSNSYTQDYKILCKNDPYYEFIYLGIGDIGNLTFTDSNVGDSVDARFMKIHNHSGGRKIDNTTQQSNTAWLLFADASHDLCYYLADSAGSRNDFVNYDKYQANDDASRFGYEWGYNNFYKVPNNIEAMSSKDMNNKILFLYLNTSTGKFEDNPAGNKFEPSEGSANTTIWTALVEFRNRYAHGSDRYSIPNHRTMMYIKHWFKKYLEKNTLESEGFEYFNISTKNCPWYWVCDQDNQDNRSTYDQLSGTTYQIAQLPDGNYKDYARTFSFNKGADATGLLLRATSKEEIYNRVRLVLELPVFDIIGTDSLD